MKWHYLIQCDFCGSDAWKNKGHVNRAIKLNGHSVRLFCDKICTGLGRRDFKSIEQKKKEKSDYDKVYLQKNKERDKQKKWEFHKRTYNPEKQRAYNQSRMHLHVEYCRRPEYKERKKDYDLEFRSKKVYGEFWESAITLNKIESIIDNRTAKLELGLTNKSQKRKRLCQKKQNSQLTALRQSFGKLLTK